jgi:hypothetical protein
MPSGDLLQHAALAINITGESYRGIKARKLASKKKKRVTIVAFGSADDSCKAGPNLGNQAVLNWEILHANAPGSDSAT